MIRTFALALGTGTAIAAIAAPPARAFDFYFGEDLNASAYLPLAEFANARQAETDFLAQLVAGVETETFEAIAPGTSGPLTVGFGESGTATLGGNGLVSATPPGTTNGFGRYSVSGSNFWEANAAGSSFTINFGRSVAAFGFYGIDLGDFGGQASLVLSLTNGGTERLEVPRTTGSNASTDGSVLYFGAIATQRDRQFDSLSFELSSPGVGIFADIFAFDDMTIAGVDQVLALQLPPEDPPAEDPPAEDPPAEDPPAEDPPAEDPDPEPNPDPPVVSSVPEPNASVALLAIAGLGVGLAIRRSIGRDSPGPG